jgi:hypothetical protein
VAAARRVALLRQREALGQCEAQYAEAAKVLGEVNADLQRAPAKAGALARDLCRSLLDKMLVEGDVSLRLLTEAAGDRACAHGLNVSLVGLLLGRASGMNETELLDLGLARCCTTWASWRSSRGCVTAANSSAAPNWPAINGM